MSQFMFVLICFQAVHHMQAYGFLYQNQGQQDMIVSTFEDSTMETFLKSERQVKYMEADLYIPGNILFVDGNSLKTTDGTRTTIITGNVSISGYVEGTDSEALYNSITGFTQISPTLVVIADNGNDCLRLLDRTTANSSQYVGYCYPGGGMGGPMSYPLAITQNLKSPDMIFVTDDYAIHQVNSSNNPPDVSQAFDVNAFYLTQDPQTGDLYTTTDTRVNKISYLSGKAVKLSGSFNGHRDGDFDFARFETLQGIIFLHDKILVADEGNNMLRVLDLYTNQTSSICSGERGHKDGNSSVCSLAEPYSLMLHEREIYVGENKRIRKIKGVDGATTVASKASQDSETTTVVIEWYKRENIGIISIAITAAVLLLSLFGILALRLYTRRKAEQSAVKLNKILNRPLPNPRDYSRKQPTNDNEYDLPGDQEYEQPDFMARDAETISDNGVYFLTGSISNESVKDKRTVGDHYYVNGEVNVNNSTELSGVQCQAADDYVFNAETASTCS